MKVIKVLNKPFDSNGYIVSGDNKKCVIIDLGADFSVFKSTLEKENLTPLAVLLTHSHFDHVSGVKSARGEGIDVYISRLDAKNLESSQGTLSKYVSSPYEPIFDYKTFTGEEELNFGDITVKTISTPGHTKGSTCFLIDNMLFSGDMLFSMSIGRCDLPGGNEDEMKMSINGLIALLFDKNVDYTVYPGHGDKTTLRTEVMFNPYFK